MNKVKGVSIAALVMICSLGWMVTSPAQNSNSNGNKKSVSKAKDTVDRVREPDPPEVGKSTDTAKDRADRENKKEKERPKKGLKIKEPPSPKNNNR